MSTNLPPSVPVTPDSNDPNRTIDNPRAILGATLGENLREAQKLLKMVYGLLQGNAEMQDARKSASYVFENMKDFWAAFGRFYTQLRAGSLEQNDMASLEAQLSEVKSLVEKLGAREDWPKEFHGMIASLKDRTNAAVKTLDTLFTPLKTQGLNARSVNAISQSVQGDFTVQAALTAEGPAEEV